MVESMNGSLTYDRTQKSRARHKTKLSHYFFTNSLFAVLKTCQLHTVKILRFMFLYKVVIVTKTSMYYNKNEFIILSKCINWLPYSYFVYVLYCISSIIRQRFFLPKQCQKSRSVL